MTTNTASKLLGMSEQAVRTRMRKGILPIGICKRSGKRWTYYIFENWLDEFLNGHPVVIPEGMTDKE